MDGPLLASISHGAVYRTHLAREISARFGFGQRLCAQILVHVCDRIAAHLTDGRRVVLDGFGEFFPKAVGEKTFRSNLPYLDKIHIEAHAVPAWRPSRALKARVRALSGASSGGAHG